MIKCAGCQKEIQDIREKLISNSKRCRHYMIDDRGLSKVVAVCATCDRYD